MFDIDIHGTAPMSEFEVWHRGTCCCLNSLGRCSEHGLPTDRLEDNLPDPDREVDRILNEECRRRGII